jgi:hypothetical protein
MPSSPPPVDRAVRQPGHAAPARPHRVATTLFAASLLFAGCATLGMQASVGEDGQTLHPLNDGYALLYQLAAKQQQSDQIFNIKSASKPTEQVVGELARLSRDTVSRLETFADADERLRLEVDPLPAIERQARKAIEDTMTKRLLFTGGARFEAQLLLAQADGARYGAHLTKVMASRESDGDRRKYLENLSRRFSDIYDRIMRRIVLVQPEEAGQSD